MPTGIGPTLRQARNRRKVELSEVEASTKIRVRYLRAMENDEWDALPGDAYVRSFLRTYASFLGLDGERLVKEHGRSFGADAGAERMPRAEPRAASPRRSRRAPRLPPRVLAAVVSVGLVAVLVAIGLSSGGEQSTTTATRPGKHAGDRQRREIAKERARAGVSIRLAANAEVWVCLLDAGGRRLVDGQILEAGAEEGPFRSAGFTLSFGNGEVSMRIDGREASIPPSSSPIGYSIDSSGTLHELSESDRPTCT
jgi:Helix-turn-helix domain